MAKVLMSRLPAMSQWTGLAAIVLAALMTGTGQAAEPAHTLPDNDLLRIGDQLISLYGVSLPANRVSCVKTVMYSWPCGTIAWQALDQHLLNSKLDCVYLPLLGSSGGTTLTAECWIGEQNLNRWLVETGWALTVGDAGSIYHADERLAQQNNLGLWRGGFIPPGTWRPARLEEDAACSVCTARHQSMIRTRKKPNENSMKQPHPNGAPTNSSSILKWSLSTDWTPDNDYNIFH